jgi:1L-myo-inositol 1-phosphate cytidylyltransferase / CDP-L-myo-inositol myo-inositolphosphotransferase
MEQPRFEQHCLLLAPRTSGAERIPIFGLTPVERTVLAFRRAGVREFLLAGDPNAVAAAQATLRTGPCRSVRVRACEDSLPVLRRGERFWIARTDCHYDRRLIVRFVESARQACGSVAAVDLRRDAVISHPGAANVALWSGGAARTSTGTTGALRKAGRGLVSPDGVLTGLAVGTTTLARALEELAPEPRGLERALALVAERELVESFGVAEPWQELETDADVTLARRKVLAGAVGFSDGVVARHLNRPISRRITERLLSRNIKPWQVSVTVFLLSLAAGAGFAFGHAATGGCLAQLASVLDGVDGELARVRYQDSPFGGVYDALLDRVGDAVVIGGMTLYAWLTGAGHVAVVLGFAAVAGSSLSMLVKEKYGTQFQRTYTDDREGLFRWLLLGRDGRLFLALIAGVTGQVVPVLAYLAIGTHLHAGLRIYRIRTEAIGA